MNLDFTINGKVKVIMEQYVDDMLDQIQAQMSGLDTSPAASHLFDINENGKNLDEHHSQLFHHNVAKILFLDKRARPDIQTPVAFLSTRVQYPDVDDWKKLGRVMKYLRNTRKLGLTLECDHAHIVKWWVDGSFAVHSDMKIHTGGMMTLGKGSVYATSIKQKLNTKISTESEVVAVYDVLTQILWTNHFLNAQGWDVKNTLMYQDNIITMFLEQNGKASSGKRTRHMNIRYFYI